jgi:hypothetical protein
MLYQVEVKKQGTFVANYIVEAPNALTAINMVESCYSEPFSLGKVLMENEHSHPCQVMLATNWHNYTFHTWGIKPSPTSLVEISAGTKVTQL